MLPSLKFLHSMRDRSYLEYALIFGLGLTEHAVNFRPTNDPGEMNSLVQGVWPEMYNRLRAIGKPWDSLDESHRQVICSGISSIVGSIPMLCFTEVPEGRELSYQHLSFGGYGLIVKRQWLENNRADRVLYIGQNSPVSRLLFQNLANLRISNIIVDSSGQVCFNSTCFQAVFDLLAYIEVRENLEEFEWRIVGNHGFMGGKRESGKRIPIQLDDIEYVLVQKDEDINVIDKLIEDLAASQMPSRTPQVLCQPSTIPV